MTPLESVYLCGNYSGVRLTQEYRQRLPGVFPSAKAERNEKKVLKNLFSSVLLPRRTATGWKIDVKRLLEVLDFKYFKVCGVKHWKLHGDGREFGKRQSTFVCLNILNNEALVHGVKYQSPKDVYPFHVFYEGDSRDNIEVNLGFPSTSDEALKSMTDSNTFYLAGDEMFLESVLDGSQVLSPLSDAGWNIYSNDTKASKGDKAADGLRTSLQKTIDRHHPDSLLSVVPTKRIVLCLLHAITRCTEKLLFLEISNVLSEAHKVNEVCPGQGDFYRQAAFGNLENNISKRGVRNGNFRILFNKTGAPEPVSLNKEAALAILHPETEEFPHVVRNVIPQTNVVKITLPKTVTRRLDIKESYSEVEFVITLWASFFCYGQNS